MELDISVPPLDLGGLPARGDCFSAICPARDVFAHVTGRWGGLVLAALLPGTLRFSALRGRIGGISEKMLAQTLREFERDGLVTRFAYPKYRPAWSMRSHRRASKWRGGSIT